MDAADAKALTIPHIVLASKDEPAVVVGEYADLITNGMGGLVETYPSMVSFQKSQGPKLSELELLTHYQTKVARMDGCSGQSGTGGKPSGIRPWVSLPKKSRSFKLSPTD